MRIFSALIISFFLLLSCSNQVKDKTDTTAQENLQQNYNTPMDTATFGEGCFWCIEPMYTQLIGIKQVRVGYSGGTIKDPTYRQVSTGTTGHVEVAQIIYDTTQLSYKELLKVFFKTHNPTTLNRQGNDIGTQYRSVIFYHNKEQQKEAEQYLKELNESNTYKEPIVTEIEPYKDFYQAEDYHQNYYRNNPNKPYSKYETEPRLKEFEKNFPELIKKK